MQPSQALKIIQSLANGLDPQTSRELPAGTPFDQPTVIRALFAAARALEPAAQSEPAASGASPAPDVAASNPSTAGPIATASSASPNPLPSLPAIGVGAAWEDRPANAGKAWSREEDARLVNGFERGVSLDVLAQIHARTLASVQSRLEKLGKITPQGNTPSST